MDNCVSFVFIVLIYSLFPNHMKCIVTVNQAWFPPFHPHNMTDCMPMFRPPCLSLSVLLISLEFQSAHCCLFLSCSVWVRSIWNWGLGVCLPLSRNKKKLRAWEVSLIGTQEKMKFRAMTPVFLPWHAPGCLFFVHAIQGIDSEFVTVQLSIVSPFVFPELNPIKSSSHQVSPARTARSASSEKRQSGQESIASGHVRTWVLSNWRRTRSLAPPTDAPSLEDAFATRVSKRVKVHFYVGIQYHESNRRPFEDKLRNPFLDLQSICFSFLRQLLFVRMCSSFLYILVKARASACLLGFHSDYSSVFLGFWGHRCQYEDECETDKECTNGNGQCIDLGGTALPRKQCFCIPGKWI